MDSVVEVPPKPLLMWGEAWTEEKLLDRLSENFRLLPFVPIYSPSTTLCRLASPFNVDNRITGLRLIEVTADVLGRKSRRRLHRPVRAGVQICVRNGDRMDCEAPSRSVDNALNGVALEMPLNGRQSLCNTEKAPR